MRKVAAIENEISKLKNEKKKNKMAWQKGLIQQQFPS